MDELGIVDMDELAIEHSQLEFQEEMKDALNEAEGHSNPSKRKKQKNKSVANGISVAVITDVNLLDSFQPTQNASSRGIAIKRNGKRSSHSCVSLLCDRKCVIFV